jgi:hypothetical protein
MNPLGVRGATAMSAALPRRVKSSSNPAGTSFVFVVIYCIFECLFVDVVLVLASSNKLRRLGMMGTNPV